MGCCKPSKPLEPPEQPATTLIEAIQKGDATRLSDLLQQTKPEESDWPVTWQAGSPQLSPAQSRDLKLLLHEACKGVQLDCVDELLARGAGACDERDEEEQTPLHVLLRVSPQAANQPEKAAHVLKIVQRILVHASSDPTWRSRLDVHDREGLTPLLLALSQRPATLAQQSLTQDLVQELISAGFSVTPVTRREGCNALHLAVRAGPNVRVLIDLLEAAGDEAATLVNQPNHAGNTPLHLALLLLRGQPANPREAAVASSLLISHGCRVDARNAEGHTAVSLAVEAATQAIMSHADTSAYVEVLLAIAKGAVANNLDIFNELSPKGQAIVHVAAQLGHVDLLIDLQARGARMDMQDGAGQLPAVLAAQGGHKQALLAMLMLDPFRADALSRDRKGASAAACVLTNPSFTVDDVKEILRCVLKGWGDQQRLSAQPLLRLACQKGNLEVVQLLVLEGVVAVDVEGSRAQMPLAATVATHCETCSRELVSIATFIMERGANPVAEDNTGATALGQALEGGHVDMVMAIIRHKRALVDYTSPTGVTALYLAICQGYTALVEELLDMSASTGPRRGISYMPLHVAVGVGNPVVVEMLLSTEQGRQAIALKDASNKSVLDYLWAAWSVTPLAHPPATPTRTTPARPGPISPAAPAVQRQPAAAPAGQRQQEASLLRLSELLLLHSNCDPNGRDLEGRRPLHWAVHLGCVGLVEVLGRRERDLNPNLTDGDSVTPLFRAVQKGDQELVQAMLQLPGLDLGAISRAPGDEPFGTALHAAVTAADTAMVRTLINRPGVKADMRAFDLCLKLIATKPTECADIMAELLHPSRAGAVSLARHEAGRHRASLDGGGLQQQRGGRGEAVLPPLHVAVRHNNPTLVQLLVVRADADVDERDALGLTPLHHAVDRRAYEAASKLVTLGARVSIRCSYVGTTPLIAAVASLDAPMVKELLKGSPESLDVDAPDVNGVTALGTALRGLMALESRQQRAIDTATDIVNRLIRSGADVNRPVLTGRQWSTGEPSSDAHMDDGGTSVASTPSATSSNLVPNLYKHSLPSSSLTLALPDLEDQLLTPLLAAIGMRAVPVVDLLLRETGLEVNGGAAAGCSPRAPLSAMAAAASRPGGLLTLRESFPTLPSLQLTSPPPPALHVALQCLQAAVGSAQQQQAQAAQVAPTPSKPDFLSRHLHSIISCKKRAAEPAQPAQASEAQLASMRILRRVALDDRVDLCPRFTVRGVGTAGLLAQLASLGGGEAADLVHDLLASGRDTDLNGADAREGGATALHVAATRSDRAMIEALATGRSVDLNALDGRGMTPLACAVAASAPEAAVALLTVGRASPHAKAPLDPIAHGPDPASGPVAQALALPDTAVLSALLSAARLSAACLSGSGAVISDGGLSAAGGSGYAASTAGSTPVASECGHVRPSPSHSGEYDLRALVEPGTAQRAAAAAPAYDVAAMLAAPVDTAGRAPLLAAMVGLKLDHAQVLVAAGARLDVRGPGPDFGAAIAGAATGAAGAEAGRGAAPALVPSHFSPFGLLCQHIMQLEGGRDKARLEQAKRMAVVMAERESMDLQDGTELLWAVAARHQAAIELLAARAHRAGVMNVKVAVTHVTQASAVTPEKVNALQLAVQLDAVAAARALIVHGGALVDLGMMQACKSAGMKKLLTNPPAPVAASPPTSLPTLAPFNKPVVPDEPTIKPPVRLGNTRAHSRRSAGGLSPSDLYSAFHTALSQAVSPSEMGPVSDVLGALCDVCMHLLASDPLKVTVHRVLLAHLCGVMRKQLHTLQALRDACELLEEEQQVNTEVYTEVLPCLETLGERYIQAHRRVVDWCTADKAAQVRRMLSSNEYQDFRQLVLDLHSHMSDLSKAITASKVVMSEDEDEEEEQDVAALDEGIKAAISKDMQAAMHDIHATVLLQGEEANIQVAKMFKQAGLNYYKLLRSWLRDTVFPGLAIPKHDLEIIRHVATGPATTVALATHKGEVVAFKRFVASSQSAQALKEMVRSEAFIMSCMDHPNVIHFHGMVVDGDQFGLVVDYHDQGSLQHLLQATPARPPPPLVKRVALALQVARGMTYLHSHSLGAVVHGDLKLSNVLVSSNGRAIIDFGLASKICNGTTTTMTCAAPGQRLDSSQFSADDVALIYQAPEVMRQLLASGRRQPPSDVFSFGVLLLELLTLRPAYTDFATGPSDYLQKVDEGQRPPIPSDLPSLLQYCIKECWSHDPDRRPGFTTVVDLLDDAYNGMVA